MAALADPEEVRAHLIGAAAAGTSLTYSELLERLGYPFSRPRMRQLCVLLGEVDSIGAARDEPELAVLVVRQSDGLPGQGWWVGAAKQYGYSGLWEGPEAKSFIADLQAQSFAFWTSRGGTVPSRDGS
ncbi:MAG: ribose-phosphate pyrophosphokinase [Allosphingosinicella sp.]|uniref:ribose-phosphate pyrophosphokinase n=1 Tax=Allosphingosinicella sp. TaxID=2823234 RepID=UPI00393CD5EE